MREGWDILVGPLGTLRGANINEVHILRHGVIVWLSTSKHQMEIAMQREMTLEMIQSECVG